MIPTEEQARILWDKYSLPEKKRVHVALVARVALWLADQLTRKTVNLKINTSLLLAAALLHDIDKNIPKILGEQHPDTGVRILREEGMEEVAALVKTHPLHSVLDPAIAPKAWEEKILYLADKMVKQEIITVDERFAFWRKEQLPPEVASVLNATYPLVKELERDIFTLIDTSPVDVRRLAS